MLPLENTDGCSEVKSLGCSTTTKAQLLVKSREVLLKDKCSRHRIILPFLTVQFDFKCSFLLGGPVFTSLYQVLAPKIGSLSPLSSIAGMSHTICLDEEGPGAPTHVQTKKCIFSVDSRGFNFSI